MPSGPPGIRRARRGAAGSPGPSRRFRASTGRGGAPARKAHLAHVGPDPAREVRHGPQSAVSMSEGYGLSGSPRRKEHVRMTQMSDIRERVNSEGQNVRNNQAIVINAIYVPVSGPIYSSSPSLPTWSVRGERDPQGKVGQIRRTHRNLCRPGSTVCNSSPWVSPCLLGPAP